MSAEPISDARFMELIEQMLTTGGAWRVSMSKHGVTLHYRDEFHNITAKHADVMFRHIPRKCGDGAPASQP